VRVSREFVRMFGYLQGEIIGKTLASFIFSEELRKEAGRFGDLVAHGQTVSLETLRMRKDGQRIDLSLLPVRLQAFP
jgi:PAS domain S-box-containing protein